MAPSLRLGLRRVTHVCLERRGKNTQAESPHLFAGRSVGLRDAASLHVASIRLIWSIHGCGGDAAADDDAGVDYL